MQNEMNTETNEKTATCDRCGCVSTLPELFVNSNESLYCPACAIKNQVAVLKRQYAAIGICSLLLLLFGLSFGVVDEWWVWIGFAVPLMSIFSLVLHELSHAVVAKIFGGRVFGMHLGVGKFLVRQWIGDFYLGISMFPVSGLCFAAFPNVRWLRVRYFFFITAGLLFHVVSISASLYLISMPVSKTIFLLITAFIGVNGFMLVVNLWPWTSSSAAGPSRSDGSYLLRLLMGKLSTTEIRLFYYQTGALFAQLKNRSDEPSGFIEKGLQIDPNDEILTHLELYYLLRDPDIEKAHTAWKSVVRSEDVRKNKFLQAINFNNYAWFLLMNQPHKDSINMAKKYALMAYSMVPWVSSVRGTLGAVYVEEDEYDKGIALILDVIDEMKQTDLTELKGNIASNLSVLALAYFRQGECSVGLNYLNQAKDLAPDEIAVTKASNEILGS